MVVLAGSLARSPNAPAATVQCAMGYQLYAMRLISGACLDADSPLIVVLVEMYERMGDCVALQYGGSNMHRQMRKDRTRMLSIAPVLYRMQPPSRPKEMFVSLVRYAHTHTHTHTFSHHHAQQCFRYLFKYAVSSILN